MESNRLVNVVGWYDKNNIGDEAYKLAFEELWPDANFVFTDQPIKEADEYVIGGGDVLSHDMISNMHSFIKDTSIMSVSFPPKEVGSLLSEAKRIWVRDAYSVNNAAKSGIDASLIPDFAFALKSYPNVGKEILTTHFKANRLDLYSKRIGVVLNSHIFAGHDTLASSYAQSERLAWDLASLIDTFPASFVFIPFGTSMPWDDRTAAANVASKCKFWKKNCIIYDRLSVQDTLDLVSSLDCLISTRLHSSIFATICGVPFVDITHNHKNPNFLSFIKQVHNRIQYRSFCKEMVRDMLKVRIDRPSYFSDPLTEKTNEFRSILKQQADSVSFI